MPQALPQSGVAEPAAQCRGEGLRVAGRHQQAGTAPVRPATEGFRQPAHCRREDREPSRQGLLAFGSADPEGFTEDMGTELVAFLARVVERTAERWPLL